MSVWKLIVEYDGTRYSGWQEQRNARTVAGELRKAAENALRENVELGGSGRTDAGVHALAQVARLACTRKLPSQTLISKLNQALPKDICVLSAEETSSRFHPRHDALRRYYLYQISTRRSAFSKPFVWWIHEPLNLDAMRAACSVIVGRHDFMHFADRRGDEKSTVVVVEHVELNAHGDLILFRIGASHFLWKMVRRIVGMLVEVGLGKFNPHDFHQLLTPRSLPAGIPSGSIAVHTAPASGLFLERVLYSDEEPPPLAPAMVIGYV